MTLPPMPQTASLASSTGLSPRLAAVLAYAGWWMTGIVFWLVERRDHFVRFHAAQSIAAFGAVAGLVVAFAVMAIASLSFLPSAFSLFIWTAIVTWLVGMALWIVAMWRAAIGDWWRIPIAAELADRIMR